MKPGWFKNITTFKQILFSQHANYGHANQANKVSGESVMFTSTARNVSGRNNLHNSVICLNNVNTFFGQLYWLVIHEKKSKVNNNYYY